jgi:hypothetical protein
MAPRAHARLGPSAAARWLRCPGSVNFIEDLNLPDQAGDAADEGTILHYIAEQCLTNDSSPDDWVGRTVAMSDIAEWTGNGDGGLDKDSDFSVEITEDMADGILSGLDRIDEIPGKLFVEKRLDLSRWLPDQFGTSDVGIVGKKRITVFDWKFGFNAVSPVENEQLMIYGLGFWDNYARHISDAEQFRLIIWQPRAPGGGGEWDVSLDELLDFGKQIKKAGKATFDEDAPRIPGLKQCEGCYCPGARRMECPEYLDFNLNNLVDEFADLDREIEHDLPLRLPRVSNLTTKRMVHLAKHRPMISKFLDRVHQRLYDDALKGRPVPGLKLVEGRSPPRKWKDPLEVEPVLASALGEEAFSSKIISPTQAQKLLPAKRYEKLKSLIDFGTKKPSLVDEHDAREAYKSVADEFLDDD